MSAKKKVTARAKAKANGAAKAKAPAKAKVPAKAKLRPFVEVTMLKPVHGRAPLKLWVRRDGLQFSTYGVRDDGAFAAEHTTASSADACLGYWNALLDEQRRAGYHLVTDDPVGVLGYLRAVERLYDLPLQIAIHYRRRRANVTSVCERWAALPGAKRKLVGRLLECGKVADFQSAIQLASVVHEHAGERAAWTIEKAGRSAIPSPLLATFGDEGEPIEKPTGFGYQIRLLHSAATWLTITFGASRA